MQTLDNYYPKLQRDNAMLKQSQLGCQDYKPKWREAIWETLMFGEIEERQKMLYRKCLNRLGAQIVTREGDVEIKDFVSTPRL
jgi:hypothetical protein